MGDRGQQRARAYKGHATKRSDWRGLCRPELLRFGGWSVSVREAIEWTTVPLSYYLPHKTRDMNDSLVAANGRSPRPRCALRGKSDTVLIRVNPCQKIQNYVDFQAKILCNI